MPEYFEFSGTDLFDDIVADILGMDSLVAEEKFLVIRLLIKNMNTHFFSHTFAGIGSSQYEDHPIVKAAAVSVGLKTLTK